MKTGYIKITGSVDNPNVKIDLADGTVWMDANEIADLFQVGTFTVNKHLTALFKSKLLRKTDVSYEYRYINDNGIYCIRVYYNLDVIVFLSFHIVSPQTEIFRYWITKVLSQHKQNSLPIIISNVRSDKWPLEKLN